MNEITRIHLGRVPYEIDVSARKTLEKYLSDIKKYMGTDDEMMGDIETRMTEILAERSIQRDDVITAEDVAAIRVQLGEPRDFADDSTDTNESDNWHDNPFADKNSNRRPRRYFRDTDNAMLGGVISGLAAYTGWDVTLLRILAVIFTIIPTWGTLIIVYIIVWAVAPAAKTASEKLEMRGEPITLDSLKNSDFVKEARDRTKSFAEEIKENTSKRKKESAAKESQAAASAETETDFKSEFTAETETKTAAAETRNEYRDNYSQKRHNVNPIAAFFGVILYVVAFSLIATTLLFSVFATIILIQNNFAGEVWLWLGGASAMIASFSLIAFLSVIADALFKKKPNAGAEAAGALGGCAMFAILATTFGAVWLWTIPRDYELPQHFTEQIRHLERWDDEDICRVQINWDGVKIERGHCD